MSSFNAKDVAQFMFVLLKEQDVLYQDAAVGDIDTKFGDKFVYTNDNGNQAIDKQVLKEFELLTSPDYVWDRAERMWRKRETFDPKVGRLA